MVRPAGDRPHPSMAVTSFVRASKNRQKASPPMPAPQHAGVDSCLLATDLMPEQIHFTRLYRHWMGCVCMK